MELLEKIFLHTKQTISDQELQQISQESDYELFHNKVEKLVEWRSILPTATYLTNFSPP